jgi:hypothetical protein
MHMRRLKIAEARELWRAAIEQEGWLGSVLEKVMFDSGKPTRYHPHPPAFMSISDDENTVSEEQYLTLQNDLIQLGRARSELGRTKRRGQSAITHTLSLCPAELKAEEIPLAMESVMARTHPLVVRQEQILRCAFIAHLPENIRRTIGTVSANLHPEIPTASKEYQRMGRKKRRARIDIGFGHSTICEEIAGVVELKALTSFTESWFKKQLDKLKTTPPGLMFSGVAGDFQKLLDPKLPSGAFRYSWIVTKKRGPARPVQVAEWARSLLRPVEQRLSLQAFEESYDSVTRWLSWKWGNGSVLHLAWYWPKRDNSEEFEPVWISD